MIRKIKLTFVDKITYHEIKTELSFGIGKDKKWLKKNILMLRKLNT